MLSEFQAVTTNFEAWFLFGQIVFAGISLIVMIGAVLEMLGYIKSYRDGQIDALNGKIHYKKQEQENGEVLWIECESKKDR